MNMGRDDARFIRGLQNHGAGTVAEQHGCRAVLPVRDPRERLRTDHERMFRSAGSNVTVGDVQAVHEPAARSLYIESSATTDAQTTLNNARRAGKYLVRGCRADDDEVDVVRVQFCHLQRT